MQINTIKKRVFPFILLFGFMLHIPFAFAYTNKIVKVKILTEKSEESTTLSGLYIKLHLDVKGLSEAAYNNAVKGFLALKAKGEFKKTNILSIVDFTRPSTEKRLFVIDILNEKVLFNSYVSHGRGSGKKMAEDFSNIPESFQSSLGFYETSGTYEGKNGYSMKLNGLEKGFNNKAEERAIVMHGADYVSENFIHSNGFLGRSWGCPALPQELNKPIINTIKGGTCFFIYSDNQNYLAKSKIINS